MATPGERSPVLGSTRPGSAQVVETDGEPFEDEGLPIIHANGDGEHHARSGTRESTTGTTGDPSKLKRDEFVMDTNNSSIVSKRSVEKLYYRGEPEYFRHFVGKFKRRSPLINRGYWLRMLSLIHI